MALRSFKTKHLSKLSITQMVDPGQKPVDPHKMNQFLDLLAGDLEVLTGGQVTAITDNWQLEPDCATFLKLDPNGADRDLRLPNPADVVQKFLVIVNGADAAETITVKTFSESGTVGALAQNKAGIFVLVAGAWVKLCTWTITI